MLNKSFKAEILKSPKLGLDLCPLARIRILCAGAGS